MTASEWRQRVTDAIHDIDDQWQVTSIHIVEEAGTCTADIRHMVSGRDETIAVSLRGLNTDAEIQRGIFQEVRRATGQMK